MRWALLGLSWFAGIMPAAAGEAYVEKAGIPSPYARQAAAADELADFAVHDIQSGRHSTPVELVDPM